MKPIWVLVANAAVAEIYTETKLRGPLTLISTITHDQSKQHAQDLAAAEPGRVHDRMGDARHAMEPETDAKQKEAERFAQELATNLTAAHQRGEFTRLAIIAAPAFLGELRKAFGGAFADDCVIAEVAKDVVGQAAESIRAQLP